MKKVLHIIASDKFTIGYIKYMQNEIKDVDHTFAFKKTKYVVNIDESITNYSIIVNDVKEIFDNKQLLNNADKIIISGLFGLDKYLFFLPNRLLKKMYFQFWGGDFYSYRDTNFISKKHIHKIMLHSCIKRCGGILNLIAGDYDELSKIFPNNNNHYVVIMPENKDISNIYEKYSLKNGKKGRILLGNSATKENGHLEILKKLEHLKNDDIEIICPLSYGNSEYANEVIDVGKKLFNNKFIPITDFMNYDDYFKLLSTCSIAIFNNNRQQAMGNINAMLTFGKKVYIRTTTPMWKEYESYSIIVHNIDNLDKISYNNLIEFNKKIAVSNHNNMINREKSRYDGLKKVLYKIINS